MEFFSPVRFDVQLIGGAKRFEHRKVRSCMSLVKICSVYNW